MEPVIAGSIPVRHPLEDAAKRLATSLENWGTGNCKGSIPSSSVYPPEAEKRGTVLITQREKGQYLPGGFNF